MSSLKKAIIGLSLIALPLTASFTQVSADNGQPRVVLVSNDNSTDPLEIVQDAIKFGREDGHVAFTLNCSPDQRENADYYKQMIEQIAKAKGVEDRLQVTILERDLGNSFMSLSRYSGYDDVNSVGESKFIMVTVMNLNSIGFDKYGSKWEPIPMPEGAIPSNDSDVAQNNSDPSP